MSKIFYLRFWLLIFTGLLIFSTSCGKKIIIPDYPTAKEQWLFAMKEKKNTIPALDEAARQRQLARLEMAFLKVIEQFPDDKQFTPGAYINLGDTYLKFKQHHKAIKIFTEAIEKYPDQEDVQLFGHFGIANAYDLLGRYDDAIKGYKYCLDKFGNSQNPEFKKIVDLARDRYNRVYEIKTPRSEKPKP